MNPVDFLTTLTVFQDGLFLMEQDYGIEFRGDGNFRMWTESKDGEWKPIEYDVSDLTRAIYHEMETQLRDSNRDNPPMWEALVEAIGNEAACELAGLDPVPFCKWGK